MNKDQVMAAVKQDGIALQFAHDFQHDREVVMEAVKQDGEAFNLHRHFNRTEISLWKQYNKMDGF